MKSIRGGPALTRRRSFAALLVGESLIGAALLLAPDALLARVGVRPGDGRPRRVARVLGVRQLVQALLLARAGPRATALRAAASVDGAHAASMLLLARVSPASGRAALGSAAIAGAICCAELRAAAAAQRRA